MEVYCVLCTLPLPSSLDSAEVASCSTCRQPLHASCLQEALALDSRCPLCRAELAIVGYSVGGGELRRATWRRLAEHLGPPSASRTRALMSDIYSIADDIERFLARVSSLRSGVEELRAPELLAEVSVLSRRADALCAQLEPRGERASDFDERARRFLDLLGNILRYFDWRVRVLAQRQHCDQGAGESSSEEGAATPKPPEVVTSCEVPVPREVPAPDQSSAPAVRQRPSARTANNRARAIRPRPAAATNGRTRAPVRRRPAAASGRAVRQRT